MYKKPINSSSRQEQSKLLSDKSVKRNQFSINQKNWIGQITSQKSGIQKYQIQKGSQQNIGTSSELQKSRSPFSTKKWGIQSPVGKLTQSYIQQQQIKGRQSFENQSSTSRSPSQHILDIFHSIGLNQYQTKRTYYSKQSQSKLTQLLTDKNKLNQYIKELSNNMKGLNNIQVEKNYQVFITLLVHFKDIDVVVHQGQDDIKITFNRTQLELKQKQIIALQAKLEQAEQDMKNIVHDYQGVIRNYNDVIQKLVKDKNY